MTTGERIKQKREEKGLTQSDLAKLAHYTDKTSISKIENAGDNITTKTAMRIAKALNCDYRELFGWLDNYETLDMTVEEVNLARRFIAYSNSISKYQQEILDKLDKLSDEARDRIMNALDYEYQQEIKKQSTNSKSSKVG
jgi:transcriptional regulator with XRE-family HTH domain